VSWWPAEEKEEDDENDDGVSESMRGKQYEMKLNNTKKCDTSETVEYMTWNSPPGTSCRMEQPTYVTGSSKHAENTYWRSSIIGILPERELENPILEIGELTQFKEKDKREWWKNLEVI
jgi:hypothetical protein